MKVPVLSAVSVRAHCPVGAIYEKDETKELMAAIRDESKHVVVQVAPATRVAIGEAFGMEPGTVATGQMYAALRMLGVDMVFDYQFLGPI